MMRWRELKAELARSVTALISKSPGHGLVPHYLKLSAEPRKHFLRRFHAMILGFLENGDAAEIGVGKEDAVVEGLDVAVFFRENGTDSRANHGVAHPHDVHA